MGLFQQRSTRWMRNSPTLGEKSLRAGKIWSCFLLGKIGGFSRCKVKFELSLFNRGLRFLTKSFASRTINWPAMAANVRFYKLKIYIGHSLRESRQEEKCVCEKLPYVREWTSNQPTLWKTKPRSGWTLPNLLQSDLPLSFDHRSLALEKHQSDRFCPNLQRM